jgi:hypothetical protein
LSFCEKKGLKCKFTLIAFKDGQISLIYVLMFDGNIMDPWRTFIHLKGVSRLGFKKSNVVKFMKAKLFS